jgi:hypothetical protein
MNVVGDLEQIPYQLQKIISLTIKRPAISGKRIFIPPVVFKAWLRDNSSLCLNQNGFLRSREG